MAIEIKDDGYKRDLVYSQDCEWLRYQGKLLWSRLQTAATIEGAYLLGVYYGPLSITQIEKIFLLILGFLLVLIVSLLSIIDQELGKSYLVRIKEYEGVHILYEKKGISKWITGKFLLILAATSLNVANLVVVFCKW